LVLRRIDAAIRKVSNEVNGITEMAWKQLVEDAGFLYEVSSCVV